MVLKASVTVNAERPPPVLSILEGGYDLDAISRSAVAHVRSLARGPPKPRRAYPDPDPDTDTGNLRSTAASAEGGCGDGGGEEEEEEEEGEGGDEVAALAKIIEEMGLLK